MIQASLTDEVSVFFHRMGALADSEHTDEFVNLFRLSGCSVLSTYSQSSLRTEQEIREWHQNTFRQLEVLKLNVEVLNCQKVNSVILAEACYHCQFCFLDEPDQLESITLRVSLAIHYHCKQFKICQMHCSIPSENLGNKLNYVFFDPFSDE